MKEKLIKATKIIAISLLLLIIALVMSLAGKALDNSDINFEEIQGKTFISRDSFLVVTDNSVIIDRTSYEIKSVENDIIIVNLNESELFILKIIDNSTIFSELGRLYYYEED